MKDENREQYEDRLYKYAGPDRIVSNHEIAKELASREIRSVSYQTGVPSIDRLLDNVEPGELIVVTGPTGNGKTTLLSTITTNVTEVAGVTPLERAKIAPERFPPPMAWFSMEVTYEQFLAKFGAQLPLFYMPKENTDNNIQWLMERIVEANVKHDVKMVFIDHLHQIMAVDHFNGKNLSLEIGDIVGKLKQLAIQYKMVIWLIAHSTDDKDKITREPKMTDVRDSGMIIRLADVVMGVWRIPNHYSGRESKIEEIGENDTKTKVRVWKNRRTGKLGYLCMNMEGGKLIEVPIEEENFGAFSEKSAKKTTMFKRFEFPKS